METIKKSIRKKELLSLLVILLLFFLLRSALTYAGSRFSQTREDELMGLKANTLTDILSDADNLRTAADRRFSQDLTAHVQLTTNLLREFVSEDGYTGPRVLSDGFVAELQGERVLLPAEYQALAGQLSRAGIDESLASGEMLTRRVTMETDVGSKSFFLSFGAIADGWIYADLTEESEYNAYLDHCTRHVFDALRAADDAFGGVTLTLRETDGALRLSGQYGAGDRAQALQAQDFDALLRDGAPQISVDGQDYLCVYAELGARHADPLRIVQLLPKVSLDDENTGRVRLLRLVMVILFVAVTVYIISVQRTVAGSELSEELKSRYRPDTMRKRMINVGLLCVVLTFAFALLIEAIGLMYAELRCGRDMLNLVSEQMERSGQDQREFLAEEEEAWVVYDGKQLASLLAEYPELGTREKLQESCRILGLDYIMLFDSQGRQTRCSRDYAGFTLNTAENPELYDFRRLLLGVDSIVHEVSVDRTTGLERQLIGVKIPAADGVSMHGALLMALLPDRTSPADGFAVQDAKATLTMSGTICFAADPLTGEILYASDAGMIGRTLAEYDLPEESLQDGYMDFTSIAGSDYLVISSRENERVYYYAAQSNAMFGRIIRVGAFAALLFAAALAILLLFLLGGYTEKRCEDWEQARKKESAGTDSPRSGGSVEEKTEGSGKKADLLDRILGFLHWDQKRSGEKTSITLHIGLIILILCALDALHAKQLPNDSYNTMLGFLMHGGWMRGLNLFSLCSILMVVAVAYLINLISSLLLRMSRGVISENGDTVCLLLYSCIKYVTVFGVVYFSLGYLGFSTTTVLASLGIVSLALSLGAQDLIKDILAGLALVFDGCFRVGDVVEIGGTRGTVEEIGVRSTKLRDFDNNTLILNNHEITGILNLSKALTELSLELKIPANLSLLEVEDLLNRELPKIGAKSDKIIEGPYLLGVTDMGGTNIPLGVQIVTLTVTAMFNAKDSLAVKVFLNREICLLFEREGIPLL